MIMIKTGLKAWKKGLGPAWPGKDPGWAGLGLGLPENILVGLTLNIGPTFLSFFFLTKSQWHNVNFVN